MTAVLIVLSLTMFILVSSLWLDPMPEEHKSWGGRKR